MWGDEINIKFIERFHSLSGPGVGVFGGGCLTFSVPSICFSCHAEPVRKTATPGWTKTTPESTSFLLANSDFPWLLLAWRRFYKGSTKLSWVSGRLRGLILSAAATSLWLLFWIPWRSVSVMSPSRMRAISTRTWMSSFYWDTFASFSVGGLL